MCLSNTLNGRTMSYRSLVRFFKHIIALDRFTDPPYPILFSERLGKKTKSTNLRSEWNKYVHVIAQCVCASYSSTVMCVSDGRTRAIVAAVTSPRLLLDTLEDSTDTCFQSVILLRCANFLSLFFLTICTLQMLKKCSSLKPCMVLSSSSNRMWLHSSTLQTPKR